MRRSSTARPRSLDGEVAGAGKAKGARAHWKRGVTPTETGMDGMCCDPMRTTVAADSCRRTCGSAFIGSGVSR